MRSQPNTVYFEGINVHGLSAPCMHACMRYLIRGYKCLRYVHSTSTHILGNLKRMRTITHAIGTRPYFNAAWRSYNNITCVDNGMSINIQQRCVIMQTTSTLLFGANRAIRSVNNYAESTLYFCLVSSFRDNYWK